MKNIIIIGAGPAGLTAADELVKKEKEPCNITILEKSGEIGGISRTIKHNGNRMDIGGHRFFSKDDRVNEWWMSKLPVQSAPSLDDILLEREREFPKGGADPEKQDEVFLMRNRVSRIYYLKKFFDYPISMKPQTFINMGFNRTVKAVFSYFASLCKKREETNLESFYINRFGKVLYSMFFEGYTEKLWGRHPSQISADWGAQRVKGLSIKVLISDLLAQILPGKKKSNETSLIDSFYYPKFGPGQLWEKVANELQESGCEIKMNACVTGLQMENGKISGVAYTQNGEEKTAKADVVLSSMPLKELVEAMDFDVPQKVLEVAKGLPYRDFVTVGLLVNKLQLKNKTKIKTISNIIPDCWIYVQEGGVKLGRIQIFNNWSPYLVKDPVNTVWIGLEYFCEENDSFWNMSDEECVDFAVNELISMGIIKDKAEVLDSHRERVQKAYPAYFDTYNQIDCVIDYINNIDNLYCIGRNGQHRYNNMDHSMATAFEAADAIINNKHDKSAIWNVNTEKEYHEEKK